MYLKIVHVLFDMSQCHPIPIFFITLSMVRQDMTISGMGLGEVSGGLLQGKEEDLEERLREIQRGELAEWRENKHVACRADYESSVKGYDRSHTFWLGP